MLPLKLAATEGWPQHMTGSPRQRFWRRLAPSTWTPAPAERTSTPTLKLGTINERLGGVLTISADGLRSLGFEIVARERGACLYHEADFPLMLAALVRHIEGVQAKAAA